MKKSNTKAALYSLTAFAIYATHDVFVKILGADYSAFQIVFFNVLFGMPLVALILVQDSRTWDFASCPSNLVRN
jgi:drug/metabolite transporter (DMT)-like permease